MGDAAAHPTGGGLSLVNEWEEFAKYFMRGIKVNAACEGSRRNQRRCATRARSSGRYYDLDALALSYVDGFPGIIKRRCPVASRPRANFQRAYANDYYEVWTKLPGPHVVAHLPLQRRRRAPDRPSCKPVRALASSARRGDRLIAASRPGLVVLGVLGARQRPLGWVPNGNASGTVVPVTLGVIEGKGRAPGGPFRVCIRGRFGRPTAAYVDGVKIGAAEGINTPGKWERVGGVELSPRCASPPRGPWRPAMRSVVNPDHSCLSRFDGRS